MIQQCPHVGSEEWKEFVVKIGSEKKAYHLWMANAGNADADGVIPIPTPEQLESLGYEAEHTPRGYFLISTLKKQKEALYQAMSADENKAKYQIKIDALDKQIEELFEHKTPEGDRRLVSLETIGKVAVEQLDSVEKLFEQDTITMRDLANARRILSLWSKAGDFSEGDHLFFTEEELSEADEKDAYLNTIRTQFELWGNQANRLRKQWSDYAIAMLEQAGKEETGDLKFKLNQILSDEGWSKAFLVGVSEMDSDLFKLLHETQTRVSFEAHQKSLELADQVDALLANISKKHNLRDVFSWFEQTQSNTDSRKTGNITDRFSQHYFNKVVEWKKAKDAAIQAAETLDINDPGNTASGKIRRTAYKKYHKQLQDNRIYFNINLLFPREELSTEQKKSAEEHKAELITTLGQKGYEYYIKKAEQTLNNYEVDAATYKEEFDAMYAEDPTTAQNEFDLWQKENNPYEIYNTIHSEEGLVAEKIAGRFVNPKLTYLTSVPRRYDAGGKDLGYYDSKFSKIEGDEDVLKFYEFFLDTMKRLNGYLPKSKTDFMHINTLISIKKDVIEKMFEGNVKSMGTNFLDYFVKATRTDDLNTTVSPSERDLEGNKEWVLQTQFLENTKEKVASYIAAQKVIFKAKYGRIMSSVEVEEMRRDYLDKLAKEKSFDLGRVLKAYGTLAEAYKYKTAVEDMFRISEQILNDAYEQQTNQANEQLTYKGTTRPVTKKGLERNKAVLEDLMNHFFGYSTNRVEGQTSKQTYTKEEKERKSEVEEAINALQKSFDNKEISAEEYYKTLTDLNRELTGLGGKFTWSKVIDMLLNWVQIKGMGWNLLGSTANISFGQIGNFVEAAGNERFTVKQMRKATGMVMHSVAKFATMEGVDTKTAQKIYNLSQKYDMLKQSRFEINKRSKGNSTLDKFHGKFKYVLPYTAQAASEYLNQAPVMIATMLNTKVKTAEGETITLWDAYDEHGNLKDGVIIDRNVEVSNKKNIDEAIRWIHGNYDPDSRIAAKQYVFGRMMLQFRTWALMGFYSRFSKESKGKKGRYRSYAALYNKLGAIPATFAITKQLLRKLVGHTNFDSYVGEGFTEHDAANLRRNLQEIVVFLGIQAVGLLLASSLDDGEEPDYKYLAYALINQMNRVETDLLFYTNPREFERLQRNAIPIFGLVTDAYNVIDKSLELLGTKEAVYQQGPYKDEYKVWIAAQKFLPGLAQLPRFEAIGHRVFKTD